MDLSDFEDLLDLHGADLDRWPPAVRQDAEVLVARSAPARAAFLAMRDIEAVLRAPADAKTAEIGALIANATRHRQATGASLTRRRAAWSAAAAAALLLGVVTGAFAPQDEVSPDRLMSASFTCGCVDVD